MLLLIFGAKKPRRYRSHAFQESRGRRWVFPYITLLSIAVIHAARVFASPNGRSTYIITDVNIAAFLGSPVFLPVLFLYFIYNFRFPISAFRFPSPSPLVGFCCLFSFIIFYSTGSGLPSFFIHSFFHPPFSFSIVVYLSVVSYLTLSLCLPALLDFSS